MAHERIQAQGLRPEPLSRAQKQPVYLGGSVATAATRGAGRRRRGVLMCRARTSRVCYCTPTLFRSALEGPNAYWKFLTRADT